jgi:hypothetical protein
MKVFDIHVHLGRWPFPIRAQSPDDIVELMDKRGIEKCVVSSTMAIVYDMKEGNRLLAQALEGNDRLLGYVVANPNYLDESQAELETYLSNPRFRGVKIHGGYSRKSCSSPEMRELLATVARWRKPLLIHVGGESEVRTLAETACALPGMPVILAHAGGGAWREATAAAKEIESLHLEFSASAAHRERIGEALRVAGAHKVLFGSDMTLLDPAIMLGMMDDAGLTEAQRKRLMWDNAERLFGE